MSQNRTRRSSVRGKRSSSAIKRPYPVVECHNFQTLLSFLSGVDFEKQCVRMYATGLGLSHTSSSPSTVLPRSNSMGRKFSMRRVSMNFSTNNQFNVYKQQLAEGRFTEPCLHVVATSMPWWKRTLNKRTFTNDTVESLQHLLQWLRSSPDQDLGAAEKLLVVLTRFQVPSNPQLLRQILFAQSANVLAVRCTVASRLYAHALKSITEPTISVCWDVLCEEHEAAMIAKPASQVRRHPPRLDLTASPMSDDAVFQVIEGHSVLIDCSRPEDQFKRVIDAVDWFGRTVKGVQSSLIGVAAAIFEPHIRAGLEVELQNILETKGGIKAFNQTLLEHNLPPFTVDKTFLKEIRKRRMFLEKCRQGLVELLTNSISVLGNMVPTSTQTTNPTSFTLSASISAGRAQHPESLNGTTDEIDNNDDDDGVDPSTFEIEPMYFPPWWNDFNASILHRQSHYRAYAASIQRANQTRRIESDRLREMGKPPLPALPLMTEEQWITETRNKVFLQARKRQRAAAKIEIDTDTQPATPRQGGTLDNLRPSAATVTMRAHALTRNSSNPPNPQDIITIPHFLNVYLDKSRQGLMPQLTNNTPMLLSMTRDEFSLLYQRCVRLRDACTSTVESCAQTISKLATLERVLIR